MSGFDDLIDEPDPSPSNIHSAASGIHFEAELNAEQFAAVTAGFGPALVLAGAGSGKTRTLTYRVAWLLEQGVRPWQILLLTFTNKAAREMTTRIEDLTGVPAREFWSGTFHSVGQRLLRRYGEPLGLTAGFSIMDQGDSETLLTNVVRSIDNKFTKDKNNPKPRVIHGILSYARNTARPLSEVVEQGYPWLIDLIPTLEAFAESYATTKREQQLCDYDDLLDYWLQLLTTDKPEFEPIREHLQSRFQHILVDEYQDTNIIQASILNRMAERSRNLMIVGDNWQCIYTWRGAEFGNMEAFSNQFGERKLFKIVTNYRSTPEILDFANALMTWHPHIDGYPLELRAHQARGMRPVVVRQSDSWSQANWVLRKIRNLLAEGYSHRDIAVLYRAHYQAMDMQIEMSRAAIPFSITSGVRFFEQAHVRDFTSQLRFVSNPWDVPAFTRLACLLPRVGENTAQRIHRLLATTTNSTGCSFPAAMSDPAVLQKVPAPARADWENLAATLQQIEEAMGKQATPAAPDAAPSRNQAETDLFDLLDTPTESNGAKPQPAISTPAEVVQIAVDGWYTDFMRNVYDNWESRKDDLQSLITFAEKYDSLPDMLSQLVLLNSETSDRKIDPDANTVKLTTVHQAKGLEFPVVFVIGMADELFPLKRAIENGDVEEERRLFYVAVTRAKQELYLIYPRISTMGGRVIPLDPSRFIADIPRDKFDLVG